MWCTQTLKSVHLWTDTDETPWKWMTMLCPLKSFILFVCLWFQPNLVGLRDPLCPLVHANVKLKIWLIWTHVSRQTQGDHCLPSASALAKVQYPMLTWKLTGNVSVCGKKQVRKWVKWVNESALAVSRMRSRTCYSVNNMSALVV